MKVTFLWFLCGSSSGSEGHGGTLSECPAHRRGPGGLHSQCDSHLTLCHQPGLPQHRAGGRALEGQRDALLCHLFYPHPWHHASSLPRTWSPGREGKGKGEEPPPQAVALPWFPKQPNRKLLMWGTYTDAHPGRQAPEHAGWGFRKTASVAGAFCSPSASKPASGGCQST